MLRENSEEKVKIAPSCALSYFIKAMQDEFPSVISPFFRLNFEVQILFYVHFAVNFKGSSVFHLFKLN